MWQLDPTAVIHVCGNKKMLSNVKECPAATITTAGGERITVTQYGTATLTTTKVNGGSTEVTVNGVYYNKDLPINAFSWMLLVEGGWDLHTNKERVMLISPKGHKIVLHGNAQQEGQEATPEEENHL